MHPFILTLCFFFWAIVFKALADTITHHFGRSVFRGLRSRFWNPDESWLLPFVTFTFRRRGKVIFTIRTKYRPDAWHISNSLTQVFFCAGAVVYEPWAGAVLDFAILGVVLILGFKLFYDLLFFRK